MSENIDLTKILKDCPKGWKFWSPIFGEVEFVRNYGEKGFVNVSIEDGSEWSFASDATIFFGNIKSREVMLYPSKELRDWSKFTAPWYKQEEKKKMERFDPKTLKVFDKVLARVFMGAWFADFVSVPGDDELCDIPCLVGSSNFNEVIPYNDETKHLLGTTDEAPDYYQYVDEDDEWDDED